MRKQKNYVTIHFKMRYTYPKGPLSLKNAKFLERLVRSAREMQTMSSGAITADESSLSDATDAIESLTNVMKRARACGGGK